MGDEGLEKEQKPVSSRTYKRRDGCLIKGPVRLSGGGDKPIKEDNLCSSERRCLSGGG